MRLVIYKDVLTSGRGADRATGALANALADQGYEVYVLTQEPVRGKALSVTFGPQVQVHLVAVPPRRGWRWRVNKVLLKRAWGARVLRRWLPGCDWVLQVSRRLRAELGAIAPDGVLSAGSNELIELMAEGALPWPVVQMFHVYPPTCFGKDKEQRVTRLKAALPLVKACQVLMPSFKELLAPYTSVPVVAIGNGVAFDALPDPLQPRLKQIVYVAYFTKDKDHVTLLEAFAQLKQAEAWTLELYGSGTAAWEARLRAKAEALGIAERVHFNGVTAHPAEVLARAAVCAYPSRVEGFGMALVEAMGAGCACVGFASAPGVNELIEPERTGLLAAERVEAFAEALQRLVDDEALRMRLGQAAALAVREQWTHAMVLRAWMDFLNETFK
ncbi:MAG: glycosyltransferase [Candidatus Spyradenecus sp.]